MAEEEAAKSAYLAHSLHQSGFTLAAWIFTWRFTYIPWQVWTAKVNLVSGSD
jgi:hypothetical protein